MRITVVFVLAGALKAASDSDSSMSPGIESIDSSSGSFFSSSQSDSIDGSESHLEKADTCTLDNYSPFQLAANKFINNYNDKFKSLNDIWFVKDTALALANQLVQQKLTSSAHYTNHIAHTKIPLEHISQRIHALGPLINKAKEVLLFRHAEAQLGLDIIFNLAKHHAVHIHHATAALSIDKYLHIAYSFETAQENHARNLTLQYRQYLRKVAQWHRNEVIGSLEVTGIDDLPSIKPTYTKKK
ncbi:hypothetical protein DSO57_1005308 [Entomophthora muscae]|uniref:Uncharacterized protein n=1 Tax=Entomophthora muscae TaxID=34485 RepID=A0ACC2UH08_9FUNG|nr:hypothetical protein DSO57_1005308 [Entomophthora muscae]